MVLDWWFVADVAVADALGAIDANFANYSTEVRTLLGNGYRVRRGYMNWAHFFWGFVIERILKLGGAMRFVLYEGVDFILARNWVLGASCHASVPSNAASSQAVRAAAHRLSNPSVQCPVDSRNAGGARLVCPWYAPACGVAVAERMLALEAEARVAINATAGAMGARLPMKLVGKGRYMGRLQREQTQRRRGTTVLNVTQKSA